MSYSTLMVNLAVGGSNAALLRVAGTLAKQFDATVIGVAARQPMQMIYTSGCYVSPELIEEDRQEIEREMQETEAEFRGSIQGVALHWRSEVSFELPADFVVRQARRADLLLTGAPASPERDPTRVGSGDLLMQAGRPILVVPQAAEAVSLDHVVLAWKDTRETRRAAFDALPLMTRAKHVTVVQLAAETELADAREELADVAQWLESHGIAADTVAVATEAGESRQLNALAKDRGAGLIVAGGYGHSRLREWALGGMTRDLLLNPELCAVLSH